MYFRSGFSFGEKSVNGGALNVSCSRVRITALFFACAREKTEIENRYDDTNLYDFVLHSDAIFTHFRVIQVFSGRQGKRIPKIADVRLAAPVATQLFTS